MTTEEDVRPKWLLELENRKRKPRLAHEAGAGAPCLTCDTACPGLDLHFWRKICKNCKCSRDDHDVADDEFPQFDLLFGPSGKKPKRKSIMLRVANKKELEAEAAFEWVPPDTTKELAADYMNALPQDKLPIEGSTGAALRRQQLQKQLPLHDIDHKACDELSEQEKKQFEKYLENLKNYAGQGKVTKIMGARPFDLCSLMTPANAADMQRFSPKHKQNTINLHPQVNLRTPSSFLPIKEESMKKNKEPGIDMAIEPSLRMQIHQSMSDTKSPGRYHRFLESKPRDSELVQSCDLSKSSCQSPQHSLLLNRNNQPVENQSSPLRSFKEKLENPLSSLADSEDSTLAEKLLCEALLPPSSINSNDIVGSTLDEQRLMFIREQLTDKYSKEPRKNVESLGRKIESMNLNSSIAESTPVSQEKLLMNNPTSLKAELSNYKPNNLEVIYSQNLENPIFPQEAAFSNKHILRENPDNVGGESKNPETATKGPSCHECSSVIGVGSVVVTAEKAKDAVWHPGCFKCSVCTELLVDLVYFYYKNKLYCARDLATLLEIPRCFACDELIFVRKYTVAEGHNYHVRHFCCWDCDEPLAGQQYISENDRPLCLPCYQKSYAKTCSTCKQVIAADQQGVAIKNLDFHATDQCFSCFACCKSLLNGRMAIRDDKPFCCKECILKYLDAKV